VTTDIHNHNNDKLTHDAFACNKKESGLFNPIYKFSDESSACLVIDNEMAVIGKL